MFPFPQNWQTFCQIQNLIHSFQLQESQYEMDINFKQGKSISNCHSKYACQNILQQVQLYIDLHSVFLSNLNYRQMGTAATKTCPNTPSAPLLSNQNVLGPPLCNNLQFSGTPLVGGGKTVMLTFSQIFPVFTVIIVFQTIQRIVFNST